MDRIATALADSYNDNNNWEDDAKNLIAALSNVGLAIVPIVPTDEMRDAGDGLDAYAEDNDYIRKADASQHWEAMITKGRLK